MKHRKDGTAIMAFDKDLRESISTADAKLSVLALCTKQRKEDVIDVAKIMISLEFFH